MVVVDDGKRLALVGRVNAGAGGLHMGLGGLPLVVLESSLARLSGKVHGQWEGGVEDRSGLGGKAGLNLQWSALALSRPNLHRHLRPNPSI